MGKRGRRKAREAGELPEKKPQRRLGQPGAYMVCRECKAPLTLLSLIDREDESQEEKVAYTHPLEWINSEGKLESLPGMEYSHEAVPVAGDPLSADVVCDVCHAPKVKYVFVPRRQIRLDDPAGTGGQRDYSAPWNICDGCLPAVKAKNITAMIDRHVESPWNSMKGQPDYVKSAVRPAAKLLFVEYFASNPAGPYKVKISPKPKPQGTPGSRRGM
ncbi:hypothetical protein ACFC1L_40150 [Streptomyces sp. NPDC056210]|uniref:hypothetical protein n=1 Tax=Streptomyces sp. NPDC056210 TaxID=3345746 RepID=UPI0035DDF649